MEGGGGGKLHGGGSGYLQYQRIWLSTGISSLHAVAGACCFPAQPSTVTYNGTSIVANPGQRGEYDNGGGAGYSGGAEGNAGFGAYNGGSGGSDGGGSGGGSGTHEDISDYIFTTWNLTPGDGGSAQSYSGSWYGGGGGGVMVDGSGPETDRYNGQGYGGGGNGWYADGLPGLVLLEISSG